MADDDDVFSDDYFSDIPSNTLDQLEHHAFTSTQKPKETPAPVQPPLRKTVTKNKNLPWRPPQPSRLVQQQQQRPSAPPPSAPEPPSSDYGFGDEDVIDLDEPSMVIQPASKPPVKPYQPPRQANRYGGKSGLDPETEAAFAAADAELGSQTFGRRWPRQGPDQQVEAGGSLDVSALQARIAELEAEQARLRQSEQEAMNEARAKQGEISIVRSNQEKLTKQYEARISVMQKLHADESAKYRAEMEASKKEREKMETDNRFLQHDLAQEAERAKRVNVPKKSTQMGTPKRSKRAVHGDGFDDHDLQASPSRSRDKPKDHTPKVGAKRKRPANDSPVAALSFTQPPQPVLRQESTEQTTASFDQPVTEVAPPKDDRYEFMQLILNHCPDEGQERTIEQLTDFHFPSKPNKSLSAILIDAITHQPDIEGEKMALRVSRALLDLWHRCLEEQYMAPCHLIVDMLHFALQDELLSTKAALIEQAIPLCSRSIDLISVPLGRASRNQSFAASLDREALDKLADDLDLEGIIDLLFQLCQAASLSSERNETFWRTIEFTFVMLTLNKAQPVYQIMTVLQMLMTSARPTTFSVIVDDPAKQVEQEKQMIDRLTNLLFENPDTPKDEAAYTDEEVLEMRVEVLKVLREICLTDHGTLLLAQHRSAIGRLVRFLDAQVNKLYRTRPSVGLPKEKRNVHDWIIETINTATRLLYHLLRAFDDPPAAVQKLHAVHGGYHKFLVSLTRIAFSEQLVFENGIEDEAAEAAHNILDNILGPEDGEAVMKAMDTPRGTKGSTTEKNTTSGDESGGHSQGDGDTTMEEPG